MEPAAVGKGGRRFPHVALLYVLVGAVVAAQLAGFLLLRHGLADVDRVCVERVKQGERRTVSHVTDLLVKATRATHGTFAEFAGGEVLTPPPGVAGRRRPRRQAADEAFADLPGGYGVASGDLLSPVGEALDDGSGSGGFGEEVDAGLKYITSFSRIPVS